MLPDTRTNRVALRLLAFSMLLPTGHAAPPCAGTAGAVILLRSFQPEKPLSRAGRPGPLVAVIENRGPEPADVTARLAMPPGVRLLSGAVARSVRIPAGDEAELRWEVAADRAGRCEFTLQLARGDNVVATAALPMEFLAPREIRKLDYIPEPKPVPTSILVGAHNCPLWEADKTALWANVLKHPERTPALGFYAQENPEVADWETKWATEHGVSFFVYCWYRDGQGGAVKTRFGSAIHDALFKSRFVSKMKFAIMWENQNVGRAGIADEEDLATNLLPYWIENYFKHPSYLKIDGKPLLFIYRPEFLIKDLGSLEKAALALDSMRQACRKAGFAGLDILGEYRGLSADHLHLMKRLGLDCSFAYCWPVPNSPTPRQAIDKQIEYITRTRDMGILPQVVTVSQAWSGWRDEGSIWKIPPNEFEDLLRKAKDVVSTMPPGSLGSRMLLVDNWNEWSEGHYIAPYREYGFGYLDAIRKVFSSAPDAHEDLLPEDVGLGPYDAPYKERTRREKELNRLRATKVEKPGANEPGLVAWWSFDEEQDTPVAFDDAGHGLGGVLHKAARGAGIRGRALVCEGGAALVPADPRLPSRALTIECWVRADAAGPGATWILNRITGAHTAAGFRLGLAAGRPCFQVPATPWSHNLVAKKELPLGRWAHLAGTFDGQAIRIYVDGEEQGVMPRPEAVNPTDAPLCLGSFAVDHEAHFVGRLDEVRLFDRALAPAEIRRHYLTLQAHAGQ